MGEAGNAIKCGKCGRRFAWKPEYAGRRVKCRCGHVTVAPTGPPARQEDDLYDIAPDPAPAPHASAERSATAAPPASHAATPSKPSPAPPRSSNEVLAKLGLAPQRVSHLTEEMLKEDREATEKLLQESPLRDIVVPILLIGGGLALGVYELTGAADEPVHSYGPALVQVLTRSALGVGLVLGAALLAVAVLEVTFIGSFRKSILKLTCIAIGPAALPGILVASLGELSGAAAGAFATIGIYVLLCWYLLRLSLRDTAMLVLIIWIIITTANYMAFQIEGAMSGAWI